MHVVREGIPAPLGGTRERADHQVTPLDPGIHELTTDGPVAAPDQVAIDRVPHRLRHDNPDPKRLVRLAGKRVVHGGGRDGATTAPDHRTEVVGADHPVRPGEHRRLRGELGAPLAAAGSEDAAACACAHPQPEAVHLRTTPIVRLESSLGHGGVSKTRLAMAGKNRDRLGAVVN